MPTLKACRTRNFTRVIATGSCDANSSPIQRAGQYGCINTIQNVTLRSLQLLLAKDKYIGREDATGTFTRVTHNSVRRNFRPQQYIPHLSTQPLTSVIMNGCVASLSPRCGRGAKLRWPSQGQRQSICTAGTAQYRPKNSTLRAVNTCSGLDCSRQRRWWAWSPVLGETTELQTHLLCLMAPATA